MPGTLAGKEHVLAFIRPISDPALAIRVRHSSRMIWMGGILALSGAAALIHEVSWARRLGVALGHAASAHALVVAVFMAGLAIGYQVGGRLADHVRRPLLVLAVLEVIIGGWALLFGVFLSALQAPLLAMSEPLTLATRVVPAGLLLLPPTVAMGMTLPLAVRHVTSLSGGVGERVAGLYALNSAGAVAGALLAGLLAIEHLGLQGTVFLGAGINGVVAVLAFLRRDVRSEGSAGGSGESESITHAMHWEFLGLAAILGVAAMMLQGTWIRLAAVILGSSTYAFSLVVAAFVAGIAGGSELLRRHLRAGGDPLALLIRGSLAAAIWLWATGEVVDTLPWLLGHLREWMPRTALGFWGWTAARMGVVMACVCPPVLLFGAALPALVSRHEARGVGSQAGGMFASNTVGAVVGASLAGPVLVPAWGLEATHDAVIFLLLFTGLGLWLREAPSRWRVRVPLGLAALGILLAFPTNWEPRQLNAGVFRDTAWQGGGLARWEARMKRNELLFHEDGADATVVVLERGGSRVLKVNGKADASDAGDMFTQVMSAHLPLLLHPSPERALVVGLGSGVTAASALLHPVVVDVVELSESVTRAADHFSHVHAVPLDSERLRLHVEDARNHLDRVGPRFDVIISEPSNPWVAGNAGLFTVELFERMRERLRPGGLLAQWFHLYEMDDETVALVIRTLGTVFPHVSVFQLFPTDLILLASMEPLEPDLESMAQRLREEAIARDVKRVGLAGMEGLLSLESLGPVATKSIGGEGMLNRDGQPVLEFMAPRRLFLSGEAGAIRARDQRHVVSADSPGFLGKWLARHPMGLSRAEELFVQHTRYSTAPPSFRSSLIPRLLEASDQEFLTDVLMTLVREGRLEDAFRVETALSLRTEESPRSLYARALAREAVGTATALAEAQRLLARCVSLGDEPAHRCQKRTASSVQ